MIREDNVLYPTPARVAEARDILHRELITGEYLHPVVRANCEQVLRFEKDLAEGVWTMTESEFKEEIRKAKYEAYEEGWHGGAGWPQSEGNPYKATPSKEGNA